MPPQMPPTHRIPFRPRRRQNRAALSLPPTLGEEPLYFPRVKPLIGSFSMMNCISFCKSYEMSKTKVPIGILALKYYLERWNLKTQSQHREAPMLMIQRTLISFISTVLLRTARHARQPTTARALWLSGPPSTVSPPLFQEWFDANNVSTSSTWHDLDERVYWQTLLAPNQLISVPYRKIPLIEYPSITSFLQKNNISFDGNRPIQLSEL